MSKRTAGLAAILVAAVAVAIPTFAGADGEKSCSLKLTARLAAVKTNSGSPPVNGSSTAGGTVDGTVCGKTFHGAARAVNRFTFGKFRHNTLTFGPLGSFRAKGHGSGTQNSGNGSATLSGHGKITGGTGIYDNASGSIDFKGTVAGGSQVATLHITGRIDY
jgi:hypothetical protein